MAFSPDDLIQKKLEVEIKVPPGVKSKMTPTMLERWINDTLTDCDHFDIPNLVMVPKHKKPIERYQLDRITLKGIGFSEEKVFELYRGLFVHSIGFNELLVQFLENHS